MVLESILLQYAFHDLIHQHWLVFYSMVSQLFPNHIINKEMIDTPH
jgi:hypothetical protein